MTKNHPRKRSKEDGEEERASLLGLGRAVTRLRLEAEMTRDAVAKKGNLTGNTITHVEKGLKVEPRWETFRRLAKGLSVEVDVLVLLGVQLAPGEAGRRLRERERENREYRRALEEAEQDEAAEEAS